MAFNPVDYIQFRDNSIVVYTKNLEPSVRSLRSPMNGTKRVNDMYTGEFTKFARKNLLKSLYILSQVSKSRYIYNPVSNSWHDFKLSFLTLTLSQSFDVHNNNYITKNLLSPFLKTCSRKYGLKNYVWRLEFQQNKNIHYHVLSDMFCPHDKIKHLWNSLQYDLGMLTEFYKKYHHYQPNSIDIKNVSQDKATIQYLLKYASKQSDNAVPIKGRIWDSSKFIKSKNYFTISKFDNVYSAVSILHDNKLFNKVVCDRFTIYKPLQSNYLSLFPESVQSAFRQYFTEV